ncbi:MAG TPA: RyR domain-containing protein [Verrucomicrobiales bacterium]|nr:RyR domain-containing protein [Verrucomicrobiales bacterium]
MPRASPRLYYFGTFDSRAPDWGLVAAISEHEGWMAEKTGEGWIYGPRRDDTAKIHPSIIPYAELSEEEREKDRSAVRNYPALLQRAGLKLQRSPAELTS